MTPKLRGKEPAQSTQSTPPHPKLSPNQIVLRPGHVVTYEPNPSSPVNKVNKFHVLGEVPKPSLTARTRPQSSLALVSQIGKPPFASALAIVVTLIKSLSPCLRPNLRLTDYKVQPSLRFNDYKVRFLTSQRILLHFYVRLMSVTFSTSSHDTVTCSILTK